MLLCLPAACLAFLEKECIYLGCCSPPPALPAAVQPQTSQMRAVSPFATAAPATLSSQAAALPMLLNQDWGASLGLDEAAALPSLRTNAARADSMDAMLSVFTSEQPAARIERLSSLTLSRGLSAVLDGSPQP